MPEKTPALDYRSALSEIMKGIRPPRKFEVVPLSLGLNRLAAEAIVSPQPLPSASLARVEGYAIRAEDTQRPANGTEAVLKVVGVVGQGRAPKRSVGPRETIQIASGCPVPRGANAVIPADQVIRPHRNGRVDHSRIEVRRKVVAGDNISPEGFDMKKGDLVVKEGASLTPRTLALAAAVGFQKMKVFTRPSVGLMLIEEGAAAWRPAIPGGLNPTLQLLATELMNMGVRAQMLGTARRGPSLRGRLRAGLHRSDILIVAGCPGGAQMEEQLRFLLKEGDVLVRGARVKPGEAFMCALVSKKPIFLIPGDCAGALVDFEVFLRPALLHYMGSTEPLRSPVSALLQESIAELRGPAKFIRAYTWVDRGTYYTLPSGQQGSAYLHSLARANSLIVLDEDSDNRQIGDEVKVLLL
ncbi:MAG: molybdopterin molybdotransferase MoeA [Nitrospirae bacterium]|nr:molybdopterin molybdotransferase MoeA [Nitrospirota bacterium]